MPPSFVRQLRNNTAQLDGTTVKLGAHILAAAAARTSNKHIPCIRTLRISVRLGVGVPPATATKLQYHLRKAQISLLPKATISHTQSVYITHIALRLALRQWQKRDFKRAVVVYIDKRTASLRKSLFNAFVCVVVDAHTVGEANALICH